MQHIANILGRRPDGKDPAVALGAGAAGGLGYGLLVLGATRSAGITRIMQASGFSEHLEWADLVITGEGSFDWQSLRGKVVTGVAMAALNLGKPVVVMAGQVSIGRREWTTIGVSGAYAMVDIIEEELCFSDPSGALATTAARVARTWAH
jgi:glycerate kinase